jgi:hypothetical protein
MALTRITVLALTGAAFVAAVQPAKADATRTIGKVLSGVAAGGAYILSEAARLLQPSRPQKARPKDIAKDDTGADEHREAKISHIGGASVVASHDEPDPFANVPSATPVKADD